jgi:hypothetical protein
MLSGQTALRSGKMIPVSLRFTCVSLLLTLMVQQLAAHPGAGILVDANGRVFFVDTGEPGRFRGFIWMVDARGQLSAVYRRGGHWLALDASGRFLKAAVGSWFRADIVPIVGSKGAVIQGDGAPMVVGPDGSLYYGSGEDPRRAGAVQIARLSPNGTVTQQFSRLRGIAERLGGIKGLAAGRDGALYVSYSAAVQKVTPSGAITTITDQMVIADCDRESPEAETPSLRGLAVDARGIVYAAATGCRTVVRITSGGKVEAVLKAERPWSPTGVAVFGDDVYILEYAHANGSATQWLPRVRKLRRDGTVLTVVTISAAARDGAEL